MHPASGTVTVCITHLQQLKCGYRMRGGEYGIDDNVLVEVHLRMK